MEKWNIGLGHLFMTIFLHNYSAFMVIPAITDVTMSALCPGRDECSLAIYLTGFQQAAGIPNSVRRSRNLDKLLHPWANVRASFVRRRKANIQPHKLTIYRNRLWNSATDSNL
ncbi:hypothetical protein PanWU01x14_307280 [Parasponia andersonii]|uniref:Uncharacterized protein n=1 Tax=Parasponia andersonii TaxID=3476 RepID=A0A2P5ARB9_PARAD|nr:hypothetical protein PanWU01x14_307280 [Parasponia andersonii]